MFFDPRYEKKYPKGFPYRKKANKPQTIILRLLPAFGNEM